MFKNSKLYSILFNKCPRCHEGQFFKTNSWISWRNYDQMNPHCEVCGESFEREPGFYFGAMFMSYALYVALVAVCFFGLVMLLNFNTTYVLASLVLIIVALQPAFFRLGRLLWINVFVSPRRGEEV
jgi:uncharacterized protein (DUF983 family)